MLYTVECYIYHGMGEPPIRGSITADVNSPMDAVIEAIKTLAKRRPVDGCHHASLICFNDNGDGALAHYNDGEWYLKFI